MLPKLDPESRRAGIALVPERIVMGEPVDEMHHRHRRIAPRPGTAEPARAEPRKVTQPAIVRRLAPRQLVNQRARIGFCCGRQCFGADRAIRFLPGKAERPLKDAGLKRINISLDTLDRKKYRQLTGADLFDTVWNGIEEAASMGFSPIKINVVVMKGFNDTEIEQMARLTLTYPFHVRFIEYMPIGTDPVLSRGSFLPASEIRKRMERAAPLATVSEAPLDGPAKRYRFKDAPGELGLITAMSDHFCGSCNRLRLTAKGELRPCLLSDETVDILTPLRENARDEALAARFIQAIRKKQNRHHMDFSRDRMLQTKMVSIGG